MRISTAIVVVICSCLLLQTRLSSGLDQFRISKILKTTVDKFKGNSISDFSGILGSKDGPPEEWASTLDLGKELYNMPSNAESLTILCDRVDESADGTRERLLLTLKRRNVLSNILKESRDDYIKVASFLSNRIPRDELPNLQDIPPPIAPLEAASTDLTPDCALPNVTYSDSVLDDVLLGVFRSLVQDEIKYSSPQRGIKGLLEEGRHYMLSEEGTPDNQHSFVRRVLAGLMTPFLPPFYRIFMAGIIPATENNDPEWLVKASRWVVQQLPEYMQEEFPEGKQLGPWFYAPWLTSVVTPTFLNFLVGPSRINRRKDGALGGIVVEKCKFLQESGCKGLCLHQCKLPAQQFFADNLGVPLTVQPNFATQECQWSWGEVPVPHQEDPAWPTGCLSGCPTRSLINEEKRESRVPSPPLADSNDGQPQLVLE